MSRAAKRPRPAERRHVGARGQTVTAHRQDSIGSAARRPLTDADRHRLRAAHARALERMQQGHDLAETGGPRRLGEILPGVLHRILARCERRHLAGGGPPR